MPLGMQRGQSSEVINETHLPCRWECSEGSHQRSLTRLTSLAVGSAARARRIGASSAAACSGEWDSAPVLARVWARKRARRAVSGVSSSWSSATPDEACNQEGRSDDACNREGRGTHSGARSGSQIGIANKGHQLIAQRSRHAAREARRSQSESQSKAIS